MTLLQLVSALATSVDVVVVDKDSEDTIIEFVSDGVESVDSTVTGRTVFNWSFNSASSITVKVEAS